MAANGASTVTASVRVVLAPTYGHTKESMACANSIAQHWTTHECDACFTQRVVTQWHEAVVAGPRRQLQHLALVVRVKDAGMVFTIYVAKWLLDSKAP
eukprot:SAG31_NODE_6648_length_1939_cov_1.333152_2_plen_98_part_00